MESTLLQGGTVLVHDSQDHVTAVITDILIKGNTITKMSKNIPHVSSPTRIIDCRNKIISPGFIDTHHHLWQTQLKGRHGDDSLLDYMPKGRHDRAGQLEDELERGMALQGVSY